VDSKLILGASRVGAAPPSLVVIGNFDGVHRGHQQVLKSAVRGAVDEGLVPMALTFDPHPAEVLGKGSIARLTTTARKSELIAAVDARIQVVVEPFTLELAQLTPREFAANLLHDRLSARVVLVGDNFRFGSDRAGDFATLAQLGRELSFEARTHTLVGDAGGTFSSTRARSAIAAGDLAQASEVLGRPHALSGRVVRGDARGRALGVPTANLADVQEVLPPNGVYATLVDIVDATGEARVLGGGVTNIGVRPTFGAGRSIETHVLNDAGDLYDRSLRVHLIERLRDEQRFASVEDLLAQIHRDIEAARGKLRDAQPDPSAGGAWR
jgi:riboflavin kinase/FMN adenylyltransferase